MSTYWRFRCAEHGETADGEGVNHGQGWLRQISALRGPLAALMNADPNQEVELDTMYGRHHLWFLRDHSSCPLELLSEYGDVEPLDKQCEMRCWFATDDNSEPPRCDRQAGHYGMHHAVARQVEGRTVRNMARLEWR